MIQIEYQGKTYAVNKIGESNGISLYSYEKTFVKGGRICNFFSSVGWDGYKFHTKARVRKHPVFTSLYYQIHIKDGVCTITKENLDCLMFKESTLVCANQGSLCKIGKMEFIKIANTEYGTLVMFRKPAFSSCFGETDDFGRSEVLDKLQKLELPKLEKELGAENLFEFDIDLKSLSNNNTYLDIKTRIGILTYRQYDDLRFSLHDYYYEDGYWLATAYENGSGLYVNHGSSVNYAATEQIHDVCAVVTLNPSLQVITKG